MPACPNCHTYKGLWSPLSESNEHVFSCKIDLTHKFKRDKDGNFHSF
ncbi:hypothetical protein HY988_02870 [Candidatus Micrarchaeota archaeon]|nr:hypothetical protein [Candidatus Micrarchaeota archaeon]